MLKRPGEATFWSAARIKAIGYENDVQVPLQANSHPTGPVVCVVAAILLLATTVNTHAQYVYTTLSIPGEGWAEAEGVSGNDIVGAYTSSNGQQYGFLATPVPEPSVFGLLGISVFALTVRNRRAKWR